MKLYDFVRAWVNDADYDINGPVMVLSMKEVRELWDAGYEFGCDESDEAEGKRLTGKKAPDFKAFLTSKGIQLPQ